MTLYINSIGTYKFYGTAIEILIDSNSSSITMLDTSYDSYTADSYRKVIS